MVKSLNMSADRAILNLNEAPTLMLFKGQRMQERMISMTFEGACGTSWRRDKEDEPRPLFELPMTISMKFGSLKQIEYVECERLPSYFISHFMDVVHFEKGAQVTTSKDVFVPETVQKALQGVKLDKVETFAHIRDRQLDPYNIAQAMFQTNHMGLNCDIFYRHRQAHREKYQMQSDPDTEHAIGTVMAQNFTVLCVDTCHITTEHLASLNCQYFNSEFGGFYPREIRRFVKMWMQGSAPRLKYIEVAVRDTQKYGVGVEEDRNLNGIPSVTVPNSVIRRYTAIDRHLEFVQRAMRGGQDIERYDDTKATVEFTCYRFKMVVWD